MAANTGNDAIRSCILHGLVRGLSSNPGKLAKNLNSLGVPSLSEGVVSVTDYFQIIGSIAARISDPAFFVQAGASADLKTLGVYGNAIASSETLLEGLRTAKLGLTYVAEDSDLAIRTHDGKCIIAYSHPYGTGSEQRKHLQYKTGLLLNIVSQALVKEGLTILVAYPGASRHHFTGRYVHLDVLDSPQVFIEFDERAIMASMRGRDPAMNEICLRYLADQRPVSLQKVKYEQTVSALVNASFGVQVVGLNDVARILNIGDRKLQMCLRNEGTGFRFILQSQRFALARSLLRSGETINDIAANLGFEHRQSFSEAFSVWHGITPSEFLRSEGAGKMAANG